MGSAEANVRASDADRAQIVDHLRRATDDGRLLPREFDERLGKALHARTYGELDAIVADLPQARDPAKRPGQATSALRRRAALIAMTAATLATTAFVVSLTGTAGRASRPSERPPLASSPTGIASPRPVHRVLTTTGTTVAFSPPPRAPYSTTGTTVAASPPSR